MAPRSVTVAGGMVVADSAAPAPEAKGPEDAKGPGVTNEPERSECLKCQEWPMWGEIALVTGKDLRIERRSRVGITQIAPFAVTVLVLFGFALEGDSATLRTFTAGLFWVTVVFTAILAVQRSFTVESVNDNRDALRLSGLDPIAIFVGKAAALVIELLVLEVVLGFVVAVLYGGSVDSPALLGLTAVVATIAVASARYDLRRARGKPQGCARPSCPCCCCRCWRRCSSRRRVRSRTRSAKWRSTGGVGSCS
jgi:hypothetical protein